MLSRVNAWSYWILQHVLEDDGSHRVQLASFIYHHQTVCSITDCEAVGMRLFGDKKVGRNAIGQQHRAARESGIRRLQTYLRSRSLLNSRPFFRRPEMLNPN